MGRVCRVLAEALYDVHCWPTPEGQTETAALRRRFLELGVALGTGRVSPVDAQLQLETLEREIHECWAALQAERQALVEVPPSGDVWSDVA